MKININFNLKNFDGIDIKDIDGNFVNAGKFLANVMGSAAKVDGFDTVGCMVVAHELYKGNEIELSMTEFKSLKIFIDKTEAMSNLAKEQIIEELEKQKVIN